MKDSVQKLSSLLLFSPDRKVYFYYDKSLYHFFFVKQGSYSCHWNNFTPTWWDRWDSKQNNKYAAENICWCFSTLAHDATNAHVDGYLWTSRNMHIYLTICVCVCNQASECVSIKWKVYTSEFVYFCMWYAAWLFNEEKINIYEYACVLVKHILGISNFYFWSGSNQLMK